MSSHDVFADCVLRQPVIVQKVRRLPGLMPMPAQSPASDAASVLATLREQFATELITLREEARQLGLAAASKEAEAALVVIKAEQARQWQQNENAVRHARLQEHSQLSALISAVRMRQDQLVSELEPVVTRLALLVTAKLVGQYPSDRCLIADLAKQAIEAYRLGSLLQISVAASDHACLQAHESALEVRKFLKVDHELAPGSCRIDFGGGLLDASLSTQWAALQQKLLQTGSGGSHVGSV